MLAMPISSKKPLKKSSPPPLITFLGPDSNSQVKALNASGIQVNSFTVNGNQSSFTIFQHGSSGAADTTPICTCHTSSMSGTKTMSIHGHSATLKSQTHFEVSTAGGPMKWRIEYGLDGAWSWHDEEKNFVARGVKMDRKLEVFVGGDEMVLDSLLAGWMTKVLDLSPTTKGLAVGFKIVGHLMGAGGT